jgi:uncharacterized protein YuzE
VVETYLNTGGADDFFFVDLIKLSKGVALIRIRKFGETFEVESRYLKVFLESPRQLKYIDVRNNQIDSYLLVIEKDVNVSGKKVNSYLEWGKRQGFNLASGRRGKQPWYLLPNGAFVGGEILWPARVGDKYYVFINPDRAISHDSTGSSLGEGVHDISGETIKKVPVLNVDNVVADKGGQLASTFTKLCGRNIQGIFEELGLPKPNKDYSNICFEDVSLGRVLRRGSSRERIILDYGQDGRLVSIEVLDASEHVREPGTMVYEAKSTRRSPA